MFENSNIKNVRDFVELISLMILPFEKRPNLKEIISKFSQLSDRYQLLLEGNYKKSSTIPKFNDNLRNLNLKAVPSQEKL